MATTTWNLDPSHSEIGFKVRHMMISNVSGVFTNFAATLETEGDDFTTAKTSFIAQIPFVNTGSEQRNVHLCSADFVFATSGTNPSVLHCSYRRSAHHYRQITTSTHDAL